MRREAATSSRVDFLACRIVTVPATSVAIKPIVMKVMSNWARTGRRCHNQWGRDAAADIHRPPPAAAAAAGGAPGPTIIPLGAAVSSGCAEEESTVIACPRPPAQSVIGPAGAGQRN